MNTDRRAQPRRAGDALARVDRVSAWLRWAVVLVAVYVAAAVTLASVLAVANAVRAADLAGQARDYARQARDQSAANGDVARLIRDCVEPTPEGEPPTECVKNGDVRTGRAVAAIVDADGDGTLDAIEIERALQRIERAIGTTR